MIKGQEPTWIFLRTGAEAAFSISKRSEPSLTSMARKLRPFDGHNSGAFADPICPEGITTLKANSQSEARQTDDVFLVADREGSLQHAWLTQ